MQTINTKSSHTQGSQMSQADLKNAKTLQSSPFYMRVLKRAVVFVCFCACAMVLNVFLMRIFMPYSSWSLVSWDDFYKAQNVERIITGSSFAERDIDASILSAQTHTQTYNVSVPYQSLSDSYETIKQAYEEKGIREAVLGLRIESLMPDAGISIKTHSLFSSASYIAKNPFRCAQDVTQTIAPQRIFTTPSSIQYLFPWTFHVTQAKARIGENAAEAFTNLSRVDAALKRFPNWHYFGNGYANYHTKQKLTLSATNTQPVKLRELSPEFVRDYERICAFCQEKGIKLTVCVVPHQKYELASFGDSYPELMKQVQDIARTYGASYLDTNMVKDNSSRASASDFYDSEHLTLTGSTKISHLLAQILKTDNKAQDEAARQYFYGYDEWNKVQSAIEGAQLTKAYAAVKEKLIALYMQTQSTNPDAISWQVLVKKMSDEEAQTPQSARGRLFGSKDHEYQVVRDWSRDPNFAWEAPEKGWYSFIVRANPPAKDTPDTSYTKIDVHVN